MATAAKTLDQRPLWTPYTTEYHRRKTKSGFAIDSAYYKRYYSSIDAEIYFGNEFVEDIADIDWAIHQENALLFGYNSYTYDDVARGNRYVTGSFSINFTSPNYLFRILEAAKGDSITDMSSYVVSTPSNKIPGINSKLDGEVKGSRSAPMWPQTFDIDIIFGQKTDIGDPVHIVLIGVVLTGSATQLSGSTAGAPPNILERYQFMAKDIRTYV